MPTAGVWRPVFLALASVFADELVELFDLRRDDEEPFVEDVELVEVVVAVDVFGWYFVARAERREVAVLPAPVPGEKLGVEKFGEKPRANPP